MDRPLFIEDPAFTERPLFDVILVARIGLASLRIGFLGITFPFDTTRLVASEDDPGPGFKPIAGASLNVDPSFCNFNIDGAVLTLSPAGIGLLTPTFRLGGPFFFRGRFGRTLAFDLPVCFLLCVTRSGIPDEAGC